MSLKMTCSIEQYYTVVSCLDGILSPWKVGILLTLLERLERLFVLRPEVSVGVGENAMKI